MPFVFAGLPHRKINTVRASLMGTWVLGHSASFIFFFPNSVRLSSLPHSLANTLS